MIRSLIFDLDQTLIDRDRTMRQFLATQRDKFPELPERFIEECITRQQNGYADKLTAYQDSCTELGIANRTLPSRLFEDYKERYGMDAIPFEGAVETVNQLHGTYRLGLVTNGRSRGQMAKLCSSGLRKYFSVVVISESFGAKKPHPSIFRYCVEKLECELSECIYIGDSTKNDIEPAMALGMCTIWMRNSSCNPPESCTATADCIREVPDIVATLSQG